jgi:hypothetical protein
LICNALFKLQVEERNKVTEEEAKELEKATRGQSTNSKWREEREWRITASRYCIINKHLCILI